MSASLFPALFTGIFLVVVLAAIMSTVDSLLILASSAVVRDIVQQVFSPTWSERRLSVYGKLVTAIIGAGALILALAEVRMIFWFVLFAWSGLACAFTPVVLCSLFWKGTTRAGAVAGMVGGFVTTVGWVVFFKEGFYDLYEMLPGFAAGFILTISVSLATSPPEGAAEEMEAVRREVGPVFRRR
jgi:sodium/proline symporter